MRWVSWRNSTPGILTRAPAAVKTSWEGVSGSERGRSEAERGAVVPGIAAALEPPVGMDPDHLSGPEPPPIDADDVPAVVGRGSPHGGVVGETGLDAEQVAERPEGARPVERGLRIEGGRADGAAPARDPGV